MFLKFSESFGCILKFTKHKTPLFFFFLCVIYFCLVFLGECLWLDLSLIKSMVDFSKDLFPVVNYGFTTIPTYPCGQIGFIMCSKNKVSLLFAEVFVVHWNSFIEVIWPYQLLWCPIFSHFFAVYQCHVQK